MKASLRMCLLTVIASGVISVVGTSGFAAEPPPAVAEQPVESQKLSLAEIEARLAEQGVKVKEMKVRDLIVEVEGFDAQGREIELIVDRRTGETLSRKLDD